MTDNRKHSQVKNAEPKTESPNLSIDRINVVSDYLKHLSTVSSSSLLVLVTFSERFSSPEGTIYLAIALSGFLISIITSTGLVGVQALGLSRKSPPSKKDPIVTVIRLVTVLAYSAFALAMAGLQAYGLASIPP